MDHVSISGEQLKELMVGSLSALPDSTGILRPVNVEKIAYDPGFEPPIRWLVVHDRANPDDRWAYEYVPGVTHRDDEEFDPINVTRIVTTHYRVR